MAEIKTEKYVGKTHINVSKPHKPRTSEGNTDQDRDRDRRWLICLLMTEVLMSADESR